MSKDQGVIKPAKKHIIFKKSSWIYKVINKFKNIIFKSKKEKKKIDIKSLTSKEIEEELKRETYKSRYVKVLRSTIYALIIIVAFATLLATFYMPVFQISGSSMDPLYNSGEFVVSVKTNKLKRGDVIAFYHGNKILVKRVIASPGEWVVMDEDGNVFVDGLELQESYIAKKVLGEYDIEFPYQVPDGQWFVLSDNRAETIDSRNSSVGCISEEDIIGKILFRIWPIKN